MEDKNFWNKRNAPLYYLKETVKQNGELMQTEV
jgi:hypothetical protein